MAVPSPCVDICKLDGKTGFCLGCVRTRDEIRGWKTMEDDARQRIVDDAPRRVALLKFEAGIDEAR
ncbi:MAG TPA: DUF1289 domain-containing protein [Paraburkholderia sp.]|jgi:hypothetical protein|nr:DUF1289 domain-containing protein [Paraburkholderia sp.]